ncbi:hypothetical protein JTE90_001711 [Oedothorax gibbosus]|uniref:Uncharacterized protein n=1 Tax=Oedothorax gibbosus TaxID=931172 RepID=A0AAV6TTZ5_9ARAC|nr:hypothetical protein JTE90_001711 [Oedothorax gibbosus]
MNKAYKKNKTLRKRVLALGKKSLKNGAVRTTKQDDYEATALALDHSTATGHPAAEEAVREITPDDAGRELPRAKKWSQARSWHPGPFGGPLPSVRLPLGHSASATLAVPHVSTAPDRVKLQQHLQQRVRLEGGSRAAISALLVPPGQGFREGV